MSRRRVHSTLGTTISNSKTRETNPPVPSNLSTVGAPGQRLLNLLKTLDKQETTSLPEDEEKQLNILEEAIEILQQLISSCQRKGMLHGNVSLAEKVLASNGSSAGEAAAKNRGDKNRRNKRGKAKGDTSNDLTIHNEKNNLDNDQKSGTAAALDIQLVISAVLRIFETTACKEKYLLVALAADFCTASSEYTKTQLHLSNTWIIAEYELIATAGKPLLAGMEKRMSEIIDFIKVQDDSKSLPLAFVSSDLDEHYYALVACLRASASLISLFGTKLSRSTTLLSRLREIGWEILLSVIDDGANPAINPSVTKAAACLLSTIPIAGGTNNLSPFQLWNQSLNDCIFSMTYMIETTAPIVSGAKKNKKNGDGTGLASDKISELVRGFVVQKWMGRMRDSQTTSTGDAIPEFVRVRIFLQALNGIATLVKSLLARDSMAASRSSQQQMVHSEVDVTSLIALIETMLSFASAAEATYYGTKKRLRNDVSSIENGLLTPSSLAEEIANPMKIYGYELLKNFMTSVGSAGLFPFARRLMKIALSSMLTSSSSPVRKVVDPTTSVQQLDGKRKRWLHRSIVVRTSAMATFEQVIRLFGTDPTTLSAKTSSSRSYRKQRDIDRGLAIICGCLVEEIDSPLDVEEWGSPNERIELVNAALNCLTTSLKCGGEYLDPSSRNLIDSVIATFLSLLVQPATTNTVLMHSMTKNAILEAGIASLCTPWQDGASTCIGPILIQAATILKQDHGSLVAVAASSAIKICVALETPRAPPLAMITRSVNQTQALSSSNSNISQNLTNIAAISTNLQSARDEIQKAKDEAEEARLEAENAKRKKIENDESSKRKSSKREESQNETKEITVVKKAKVEIPSTPNEEDVLPSAETNPTSAASVGSKEEEAKVKDKDMPDTRKEKEGDNADDSDDDDMPMIHDCGPDDEDDDE